MQLASFYYRNFDGDSPLSSLSGHARECADMAALLALPGPPRAMSYAWQRVDADGHVAPPPPRPAPTSVEDTPRMHLICVDEYGKGTDDTAATALCCAALEALDAVRAR